MADDQLPPADELFQVRDVLKQLTSRERELKALMISDPSARTGNAYAAEVKDVTTTRTDLKELRASHPSLVDEFTFKITEKRVELARLTEDGELISLRRKTAAA